MEDEWKIMDGCGRFCTMSRWAPEITREVQLGQTGFSWVPSVGQHSCDYYLGTRSNRLDGASELLI